METLNSASQHPHSIATLLEMITILQIAVIIVIMIAAASSTNLVGGRYSSCYVLSFNFHNSM